MSPTNLITLLGPTAVGKTQLAARLANSIGGEVISADSRQVFRGMDIGTGKDLADYIVDGKMVPSYLIDVEDAGKEYSVHSFMRDFEDAYKKIRLIGRIPVLCGGTGLYLEAVLKGYQLVNVPVNAEFRNEMEKFQDAELLAMLSIKKPLHNTTDSLDRQRMIRALEIETYRELTPSKKNPDFSQTLVFGLRFERAIIRKRITQRLRARLENGMIEEVEGLIARGVSHSMLKYYGLEYKYISMYLAGELSYSDMFELLNTAIHQFAKRQMTWFRRMEKHGINIHWLEGEDGPENNLIEMLSSISKVNS
ncbi:MAG: tRNA (adenosine(37)-N6)-dimethylallyltransferase MiaA [Bacteroidetes bacterium]|nr:tRNA (adenosine(37)-N6)-dimethylallyltransferase MiaA [Bacteroidota bacterium]